MTGAAESILQELLETNRAQAATLQAIATKLGASGGKGGGKGTPTDGLNEYNNNLKKGSGVVGAFGTAISGVTSIIGGVLGQAAQLAGAALKQVATVGMGLAQAEIQMSQAAIGGTGDLTTFSKALEGLPGPLGFIAKAMTYAAEVQMQELKTYQQVSEVGAKFGGSMTQAKQAAMGMGLSMDEFANVMKTNGPLLKYFGASSEQGANALKNFNTAFIRGDTGRQIMNLGYSLEQANNLLGEYASVTGGISASELHNQKRMEQSVSAFATELDLAAQLEGVSREEKAKQMKEAAANAAIQAKLATMTQDQRDKYEKSLSRALLVGGKGAADALNSTLLGLPPMTDAARSFTAIMPGAAAAVNDMADAVQDNTTLAQSQNRIDRDTVKGQQASADSVKRLGKTADALAFSNGGAADTINAANRNRAVAEKQGLTDEKSRLENLKKVEAQQLEEKKKGQAGAVSQQLAAAKYGSDFMSKIVEMLRPLFPVLTGLVKGFMAIVPSIIKFGSGLINEVIIPVFKDLFGGISLDDILAPFKAFFKGLFGGGEGGFSFKDLKDKIEAFVGPIIKFVGNLVKAVDWEAVGKRVGNTFTFFGNILRDLVDMFDKIVSKLGGAKAIGEGLGSMFDDLMNMLQGLWGGIKYIVDLFLASPLFDTLKDMVTKLWSLLKNVVDIVISIVKSPVGTFLINTLFAVFGRFGDEINGIIDVVDGIIDFISGVFKIFSGDFKGGWEKIKSSFGKILTGIVEYFWALPKMIINVLGDGVKLIWDALKGIVSALWDGIKSIGKGIVNWFSGDGTKEKPKAETTQPSSTQPSKPQGTGSAADEAKRQQALRDSASKQAMESLLSGKINEAQATAYLKQYNVDTKWFFDQYAKQKKAPPTPTTPASSKPPSGEAAKKQQPTPQQAAQDKAAAAAADDAAKKAAGLKDPAEIFKVELDALNKNVVAMLNVLKDNVSATKSLNKNLYPS